MSHHKKIFIEVHGKQIKIGHLRVTNDGKILSIWMHPYMRQLCKMEES